MFSRAVAEDHVRTRKTPASQGDIELTRVARPQHADRPLDSLAIGFADRNSLQGDLGLRPAWAKQNSVATGPRCVSRNGVLDRRTSLHSNRLALHGHRSPLAVKAIVIGPRRVGLELEQVGLIGAQGRYAPGHLLRKANQNDWTTRHTDAPRIEGLSLHVELVEQRRIAERVVWGSLTSTDEPVVVRWRHDPGMAELRPRWAVTATAAESVFAGVNGSRARSTLPTHRPA